MIKDAEQCFEDLAKSYPELMERSNISESLGVDVGWFNIIDTLCGCIYEPLAHAKNMLKAATDYPRDDNGEYFRKAELLYNLEMGALPTIVQIKEKYASLRFYVRNSNTRINAFIQFAEKMSRCTCEKCGAPGELDDGAGWMKTHCKKHFDGLGSSDEYLPDLHDGRISPKFQDDEI